MAEHGEWERVLRFVADAFPSPSEAVPLKRMLLTSPGSDGPATAERAIATLAFLLTAGEGTAYALSEQELSLLASRTWAERRSGVLRLVADYIQGEPRSNADPVIAAIAQGVPTEELPHISADHPEILPLLTRHCPRLAFSIEAWQLPDYLQSQIYESLTRLPLGQQQWARIVGAMFTAATHVFVREAIDRAGPRVMDGVFRWLQHPVARQLLPSQLWREALAIPAAESLTREQAIPSDQLALTLWCVPPEVLSAAVSASRNDIQQLGEQFTQAVPTPLRVPTAFILCTIGLRAASEPGLKLIVRTFNTVHDMLKSGGYSSDSWSLLEPELPELGWWRDWDRCEKLRRAVKKWLKRNREIIDRIADRDELLAVHELARTVEIGRRGDDFVD
jgi:hypothetical protein